MSDMERGRPKLDLGNDLDLSDFSIGDVAPGKKEPTAKEVKAVSNNAGSQVEVRVKPFRAVADVKLHHSKIK